eukprot:s6600_g6.t1
MLQQSRPDSRLRHPHFGQAALLNGQSERIVLMGMSQGGGQSMLRFLRSRIRLGGWVGSVCHVPTAPHTPRDRDPLLAIARPTVNRSRPVRLLAGEADCVFAPALVYGPKREASLCEYIGALQSPRADGYTCLLCGYAALIAAAPRGLSDDKESRQGSGVQTPTVSERHTARGRVHCTFQNWRITWPEMCCLWTHSCVHVKELEHLLRDHDLEVGRRQKKSVLVEAAHKILASSGNNDVQRIIDKIANGEDFDFGRHIVAQIAKFASLAPPDASTQVFNHWRCLETPDRAYYTLGPFAQLELEMVEARRLIPAVSGIIQKHFGDEPDAFVRVYVDDCLHYAGRCIYNSRRPKWEDPSHIREDFQLFDIVADRSIVRVHVYDSDSKDNSAVEPLGFVEFCIADIPFEKARS